MEPKLEENIKQENQVDAAEEKFLEEPKPHEDVQQENIRHEVTAPKKTSQSEPATGLATALTSTAPPTLEDHIRYSFVTLNDRKDLGIFYRKGNSIISSNTKYAILVADRVSTGHRLDYSFNLPFSCTTWLNIGYGCLRTCPGEIFLF